MASESISTRIDRLVPPSPSTPPIPEVPVHVMLDIESLSLRPDALILSIGAVTFTCKPNDGPAFGQEFLVVPDITHQLMQGRHVDPDTQKWWAQPENDTARQHWLNPPKYHVLHTALSELASFCRGAHTIWANGIVFDISVLEHAYRQIGLKVPWKYNAIRDARTVYDITKGVSGRPEFVEDPTEVAHHPVSDCRIQVRRLWSAGYNK